MKSILINNVTETDFAFLFANRRVTRNKELETTIREFGVIQPILVAKASDLKEERMFTFDTDGSIRELTEEEKDKDNCYVVLDGQHRLTTLLRILRDEEGTHDPKCDEPLRICVAEPADWGENVNKFIIALNNSAKVWSSDNYIDNAALKMPTDNLVAAIKGFNAMGFRISTISRYICLNSKYLNDRTLSAYISDGKPITNADYERGIRIFKFMERKGVSWKLLNSRYMIDFVISKAAGESINRALNLIYHIEGEALDRLNGLSSSERNNELIANIIEENFRHVLEKADTSEEKERIERGRDYLADIPDEEIKSFLTDESGEGFPNGIRPRKRTRRRRITRDGNAEAETPIE